VVILINIEEYLRARGSIIPKFKLDTLYDNWVEFRDSYYKISATIKEDIRKYFEWEIGLLRGSERYEYIINQEEGIRLPNTVNFEDSRIDFYSKLYENIKDKFIRVRILDFLLDRVAQKEKYKVATKLVLEIESLIDETMLNEFSEGSLGYTYLLSQVARLVNIVLSFNMNNKITASSNYILTISEKYPYHWLVQYSKLLRNLCYHKKKKRIPQSDICRMIELLQKTKENGAEHDKYHWPIYYSKELVAWYRHEGVSEETIGNEMLTQPEYLINIANDQVGKKTHSFLVESDFKQSAAKMLYDMGEAEKAAKLMSEIKNAYISADKSNEYNTTTIEIPITKSHYESTYKKFAGDDAVEKLMSLSKTAYFIPELKVSLKMAEDRLKQSPIKSIFDSHKIKVDRNVFSAKTEKEKLSLELYENYKIALGVNSIFLEYVWERLVDDGLSVSDVKRQIISWDIIDYERKTLIERGIDLFWKEDYISSIHILAPQFESLFRHYFHMNLYPTTIFRRGAVQQEQTFNSFLDNEYVKEKIMTDHLFYIRFLLVEERGLNLRNDIAHGLIRLEDINKRNALLLLYAFLVLKDYAEE